MDWQKYFPHWNEVDEHCPTCNAITKQQRGVSKQNMRRLITPKWDATEMLILFMIIMILVLAWAYAKETEQCRTWISDMRGTSKMECFANCNERCQLLDKPVVGSETT